MNRDPLTKRQLMVLDFIKKFKKDRQLIPTRAEIADEFGWNPNGAQCHLVLIEKKGYIKIDRRASSRNIIIL